MEAPTVEGRESSAAADVPTAVALLRATLLRLGMHDTAAALLKEVDSKANSGGDDVAADVATAAVASACAQAAADDIWTNEAMERAQGGLQRLTTLSADNFVRASHAALFDAVTAALRDLHPTTTTTAGGDANPGGVDYARYVFCHNLFAENAAAALAGVLLAQGGGGSIREVDVLAPVVVACRTLASAMLEQPEGALPTLGAADLPTPPVAALLQRAATVLCRVAATTAAVGGSQCTVEASPPIGVDATPAAAKNGGAFSASLRALRCEFVAEVLAPLVPAASAALAVAATVTAELAGERRLAASVAVRPFVTLGQEAADPTAAMAARRGKRPSKKREAPTADRRPHAHSAVPQRAELLFDFAVENTKPRALSSPPFDDTAGRHGDNNDDEDALRPARPRTPSPASSPGGPDVATATTPASAATTTTTTATASEERSAAPTPPPAGGPRLVADSVPYEPTAAAVSACGSMLALGTAEGHLVVLHLAGATVTVAPAATPLLSHAHGVTNLAFHPTYPHLLLTSDDRVCRAYDLREADGQRKRALRPARTYAGHSDDVLCVAWMNLSSAEAAAFAATAGAPVLPAFATPADAAARPLRATATKLTARMSRAGDRVNLRGPSRRMAQRFAPLQFVTASADKFMLRWDAETGAVLQRFNVPRVYAVAYSACAGTLLTIDSDSRLSFYDAACGEDFVYASSPRVPLHLARADEAAVPETALQPLRWRRRQLGGFADGVAASQPASPPARPTSPQSPQHATPFGASLEGGEWRLTFGCRAELVFDSTNDPAAPDHGDNEPNAVDLMSLVVSPATFAPLFATGDSAAPAAGGRFAIVGGATRTYRVIAPEGRQREAGRITEGGYVAFLVDVVHALVLRRFFFGHYTPRAVATLMRRVLPRERARGRVIDVSDFYDDGNTIEVSPDRGLGSTRAENTEEGARPYNDSEREQRFSVVPTFFGERSIAMGTVDNTVRVFDAFTGRLRATLHPSDPSSEAAAPAAVRQHARVAAGSDDGESSSDSLFSSSSSSRNESSSPSDNEGGTGGKAQDTASDASKTLFACYRQVLRAVPPMTRDAFAAAVAGKKTSTTNGRGGLAVAAAAAVVDVAPGRRTLYGAVNVTLAATSASGGPQLLTVHDSGRVFAWN